MSKSIAAVETAKKILGKKRVLFVEGPDDEQVYSRWLARLDPLYAAKLELVKTGGRDQGMRSILELAAEPNVFALLDRDCWDAARTKAYTDQAPRLFVNQGRHCLENYFCAPADIAATLNHEDSAMYSPKLPAFAAALDAVRLGWVDHWAMYTTAMRLQEDMMAEGCSKYFHKVIPLPNDANIKARIATWGTVVDPAKIFAEFDGLRSQGRSLAADDQYRSCVWGWKFFSDVVLPALRVVEARKDWLIDLASWMAGPPADINAYLKSVLA